MEKRKRKFYSIKEELLTKSREAMLTAVQLFNNPNILFKSENFIILSIISWMYLMHAHFREQKIEYRYFRQANKKRIFDRTKKGAYKYWELERCLDDEKCSIDKVTKANLKFLIGLRHEIEHQMTTRIDDYLSARFQACCLNYNEYIKKYFGGNYGIDKHLSFSLQFSTIKEEHANQLRNFSDLPANISAYINDYDDMIDDAEFNDIRYSYRVLYVPKSVNHKGQADKVIEFIPANSPEAETLNKELVLIKEREKSKYLPSKVVQIMKNKGYSSFSISSHTDFWQRFDAKNPKYKYGVEVEKKWYWYDSWIVKVEEECQKLYKGQHKG